VRILGSDTNINFVGRIKTFGFLSIFAVLASIILIAVIGLRLGIDFAGGYEIQVKFPDNVAEAEIKSLVEPLGLGDARVQRFGAVADNEFLVLIREHGTIDEAGKTALKRQIEEIAGSEDCLVNWSVAQSGENLIAGFCKPVGENALREVIERNNLQVKAIKRGEREDRPEYTVDLVSIADEIESSLRKGLPAVAAAETVCSAHADAAACGTSAGCEWSAYANTCRYEVVKRVEFVGPQVGAELRNQGVMAIIYALVFILLYIAVRFDLFFSPGAVIALVHDVAITVGVFAVLQLEFNLPIIAAMLALIGYSLNDTIVVYDRIRENALRLRGRELRALVNTSINQTLSRTLLTSFTTLLVILALLFFGGGIIRDFSIALFVGVCVGTYSSVFVASPVYILLRERTEKEGARPERAATA
jgi:preprotein translocase subunit SecF